MKRFIALLLALFCLCGASCTAKPHGAADTTDTDDGVTLPIGETTAPNESASEADKLTKKGIQKFILTNYQNKEQTMTYQFTSSDRYTDTSTKLTFQLNGRQTIVVRPDNPLPGNPTVWRTEFFEAFDTVDKAMLAKGWHIVYHKVSDMYGCPESLTMMREFYDFAEQVLNLSAKPVLFGFSRGGLYAVNYAAQYPDAVGGLYLDAPVQDIRDWPTKNLESRERKECMQWYGLNNETLATFDANPIDKVEQIKHLPVIIVAGLADKVVIWEQNGKITAERLEAAGATLEVITKENCDHHPHSLDDPTPVVEFIEKHCS